MRASRPILLLPIALVVSSVVVFFAYPPLLEDSDGECSALEQRVVDLASRDSSGLLTVTPLYGSTSSQPGGAVFVRDRYPLLPTTVGCTVAFWKTVIDPSVAPAAAAPVARSMEPQQAGDALAPVIARDITPNGDPISPATVFTLPMDAVAVRVAYPSGGSTARFQVQQGKAVLSSCAAQRSTPGIAWCKFNMSLRKGSYSISLTANNVLLGQFPFAVIGR